MSRIGNANDILLSSIYYHFFSNVTKLTTPSFSLNIENEQKINLDDIEKQLSFATINLKNEQITIKIKTNKETRFDKLIQDIVFAINLILGRLYRLSLMNVNVAQMTISTTGFTEKIDIPITNTDLLRKLVKDRVAFRLLRPKSIFGIYKLFDPNAENSLLDLISYNIYKLKVYDSILAKESSEEQPATKTEPKIKLNINDNYDRTRLVMSFVYAILYAKAKNKIFAQEMYNKLEYLKVMDYINSDDRKDLTNIIRSIVSKHPLATSDIIRNIPPIISKLDKKQLDKIKKLNVTKDEYDDVGNWFAAALIVDLLMS
jgi:hypothetical protein